jgi:hypothetical protein
MLHIRVNGTPITQVKIRRELVQGEPIGEQEVLIQVPATENLPSLGLIPIDNTFVVEINDGEKPDWKPVRIKELLVLLYRALLGSGLS